MKLIRYQSTFLLQCVTVSFVLAASAGMIFLGNALGSGLFCIISIFIGFILLLNADLLSGLILLLLTIGIDESKPRSSIWFTDSEDMKKRQLTAFHEATKDNPTLR